MLCNPGMPIVKCASAQCFLNSHIFFIFWFIWWTGSRKLVIDNMSSFPCLTKTWSNHIHCQTSRSLCLFIWSGQPRIDFNKIQCWQQPCIVYFLSNIQAFPIGQSPYNRGSCGWSQCRIKCINIKTQMDWPLSPGKERTREYIFSCACRLFFLLSQCLDFVAVGPGTLLTQQIFRLFLPESYLVY